MKHKFFACVMLCLLIVKFSDAQHVAYFNFGLIDYVQKQNNPNEVLRLLVQGDKSALQTLMGKYKGTLKYSVGNISSVNIRAIALNDLLHTAGIERVEGYHGSGMILDDESDKNVRADSVKMGASPLTRSYKGDSVVIGIIDTGIDFTHPDFKDANGKSRVAYLWDQTMTSGGITPSSFSYGQEWSNIDIDAGNCTHTEASQYFGHGSNVTGAAAGNGLALGKYEGIAPNSTIISVACDLGQNFLVNVADATQYIYTKANELGMPCVISASVGNAYGSHDGTDLPSQLIGQLITAQNGRSFCASAGNSGGTLLHLGYNVEADSAYTWFRYEPGFGNVSFGLWAYKFDFNNVNFQIGVDKGSPSYTPRARTDYFNIPANFNLSSGVDSLKDTLYVNTNRIGIVNIYVTSYSDTTYEIIFGIIPDSTSYVWRLTTKGSGYFDCWSHFQDTKTSNILKANLPNVNTYPEFARYRFADNHQSIMSSFQCNKHVIAVANYNNRNSFTNYNNVTTSYPSDIVGARSLSSSLGPTRDGRQKPDISAPGGNTLAPGQLTTIAQLIISDPTKVALGGMHNVNGGTSIASPVAAGVIALYLQKNPTASADSIRNLVYATALRDTFTKDNLPDSAWGYGKINAFKLLNSTLVFGCMDPKALNYNPLANADDKSCDYFTVFNSSEELVNNFYVYPNPSSENVYIHYELNSSMQHSSLVITDISGKEIENIILTNRGGTYNYNMKTLSQGVYFCSLRNNDKVIKTAKLLKM